MTRPVPALSTSSTPRLALLVVGTALALAACAPNDRMVATTESFDVRKTHPIVLAEGDRSIDIFVAGGPGSIGARQISDIRSFAQEYRRSGRGQLIIAKPINNPEASRIMPAIRQALAEGGAPGAIVKSYAPIDPSETAPVKLVFAQLKAEVATECGRWPSDLSGVQNFNGWNNAPYENFGCSYQNAFAQQVADPLDLARPRPESATSAARTTTVLTKWSKGEPTTVVYPDENKNKIDQNVGQ